MAHRNRKVDEQMAQHILLDDPSFLKEIVERVLQELLEAEMTEHIGASPYERTGTRTGQRNGYKPRTLRKDEGRHPQPARPAGPRRHLLDPTVRPLPAKREGASFSLDGDVRRGRLDQEGQRSDRRAVRDLLLKEPRFFFSRQPRRRTGGVEDAQARSRKLPLPWRGR